ncbi:MAG: hypothetical protein JXI43_07915 [Tissierellales bacterium]|nr:hypothetical protein [Tissierellales bacterium]
MHLWKIKLERRKFPILIEKLQANGNEVMAEAYLNYGYAQLYKVDSYWATEHGYTIYRASAGYNSIVLGQWSIKP